MGPELPRIGENCNPFNIAVPVGPNLGPGTRLAHERIVRGHGPVRVDAHDRAKVVREVLGGFELEAFAFVMNNLPSGANTKREPQWFGPETLGS